MAKNVVLGAGLGGLSFSHYFLKKFPQETLVILEASDRIGGWIRSINKNRLIVEQGPRSIRPKGLAGVNTLQLVEELSLEDKIISIPSNHPAALNRMIYAKGKLHSLPSDVLSLFKKQPPFSAPLVKYLLNFILSETKPAVNNDESLYDYVSRKFGQDIADYAVSSLICGICAGDAKEISVRFLMDSLFEKEQKHQSTLLALFSLAFSRNKPKIPYSKLHQRAKTEKWNIYSFKDGLETLPKALEMGLRNSKKCDILLNNPCQKLEFSEKGVSVILGDNSELRAEKIASTIPAYKLGELVKHQFPILGKLLADIPCVTVAVVNLEYDTKLPLKTGFGFLVPPKEKLPILGVIYDSCCFERKPKEFDQKTLLTVMLGGHWFDKYFGNDSSEEFILETVNNNLEKILGITEKPSYFNVSVLDNCIPQYTVGHKERVEKINSFIKDNNLPLSLSGNSFYGVGINDVILSAKNAVSHF